MGQLAQTADGGPVHSLYLCALWGRPAGVTCLCSGSPGLHVGSLPGLPGALRVEMFGTSVSIAWCELIFAELSMSIKTDVFRYRTSANNLKMISA